MDLGAVKCSPLLRSSDLAPNQSSTLQGSFHYYWRSSQQLLKNRSCQSQSYVPKRSTEVKAASRRGSLRGSTPSQETTWKERPIKTLLIDNYDSYTYNLYQLLCVINQAPPQVIRNDELRWEDLHKLLLDENAFDNIVISPGPGSPTCAKDIGVCLQVLQECADIPILGVCLGHQALGYVHGARVVHAPEPVHGRLSELEHLNCPLFKGIPSGKGSGFQVVRYHSLMLDITSLPEDLIPTAWTFLSSTTSSLEGQSDSGLHFGSSDTRACEPLRIQNGVENCVVFGTVQTGRTNFDLKFGKDDNIFGKDEDVFGAAHSGVSASASDHGSKREVVMAISHRERPHYGVQFHPESVATSFGKQILENFCNITREFWRKKVVKGPVLNQTVKAAILKHSPSSSGTRTCPLRLYWEKVDGIACEAGGSEGIFCSLFGEGTAKDTFWLDSALQPGGARFSFMGGKGGRLWKRLTYFLSGKHGSGGVLRLENDVDTEEMELEKGFLTFLSGEIESYKTPKEDSEGLPFDFLGGFVGYLGYELKVECGAKFNQHKSRLPDACYFFIDRFIVVDHVMNDVYAVALYAESPNDVASDNPTLRCSQRLSAEIWVKQTLQEIHGLVEGGRDMSIERRYSSQPASSSLGSINSATPFFVAKSRKQYMEDVKACLEYIRNGESYELCLTTQLQKRVNSLDALGLYLTLRKMNPAPYAAWLNFGPQEVCICCSSPERFLRLDQSGMIEAKPIKGTIPRGQSRAEDEALKSKLQCSEKDRAENLMIVDLLRNDLGRVCKPGSVHVPILMAVESYATVHTMVSTVRGIKRQDVTALDCVRASFPGGSMTGAPKLRSMELLDSLECSPRGVYSGSIGFFSVNSSFDLNIVIRTLVIHKGMASLGAGGAIVSLSDPADEYEEMLLKTKAPIRAVSQHEALTSLASQDMESGFAHAPLGLHRL